MKKILILVIMIIMLFTACSQNTGTVAGEKEVFGEAAPAVSGSPGDASSSTPPSISPNASSSTPPNASSGSSSSTSSSISPDISSDISGPTPSSAGTPSQPAEKAASQKIWDEYADMGTGKTMYCELFRYISEHKARFGWELGKNLRPDPYTSYLEWSPDSRRLLLFCSFTDDKYRTHKVSAVYDLAGERFERVKVLPDGPGEDYNPVPVKPEGFRWQDGEEDD